VQATSAPADPPPTFCADHPFLLLFLGRIAAP
jgi:hypothetical protein